jgi:hypothetical protein
MRNQRYAFGGVYVIKKAPAAPFLTRLKTLPLVTNRSRNLLLYVRSAMCQIYIAKP